MYLCVLRGCQKQKERSFFHTPIPVGARLKAWACGRSLAGTVRFQYHRGHGCLSVVSVVCRQVEVCATGHHLSRGVQPSVVCLRKIWRTRACCARDGSLYSTDWQVSMKETESVYCSVRNSLLNEKLIFVHKGLILCLGMICKFLFLTGVYALNYSKFPVKPIAD